MDHNHFLLTFDTIGPEIEIYMPTYATPNVDNEIIVQGSELLALWQDFYFTDAHGTRHDFIFAYNGDHFVGIVRFNQFALGVATLYAQVKDEVYNQSALILKSLNIINGGAYMSICHTIKIRGLATNIQVRQIDVSTIQRVIEVSIDHDL